MSNQRVYKMGELFCGAGGLAKGALMTNKIVHEWATDYSEDACATYRRNLCPDRPLSVLCEDVRELDMTKLSPVDGLAFGFPCNDYSVVGKQRGLNGNYGPLYTYCVKALQLFKPLWFVAENVSGLQSANEGKAFQKILQELEETGYNLVTHMYKFEQYGVPQARHRVIIVGLRKDLDVRFETPKPTSICAPPHVVKQ